ncbi:transposase [Actinacidiphila glaucinigra]|uniref:transposase n=1 Tax=Actinacidiphila glaucinigra TaxID=235986 RepID=UPI0036B71849
MAIDMSTSYRAAVRIGLPHATTIVNHFHVVQLAGKMFRCPRGIRTASGTRPTSGYAHAASPPAEPEDILHRSTSLTPYGHRARLERHPRTGSSTRFS